ncbi:hypothetical protein CCR75_000783 [Bremia lactucae]|uniref:Uncharacterized protein n=1 Tax=Bremia lactucae TaxID=4779 RepID=A0A976IHV5_BRELC|nr:hypothetical protein CCR75_000783 [Bremia lactucae]
MLIRLVVEEENTQEAGADDEDESFAIGGYDVESDTFTLQSYLLPHGVHRAIEADDTLLQLSATLLLAAQKEYMDNVTLIRLKAPTCYFNMIKKQFTRLKAAVAVSPAVNTAIFCTVPSTMDGGFCEVLCRIRESKIQADKSSLFSTLQYSSCKPF